jgi:Pyruvate/2-oxoacid:ferredoxin oxidoreductase gamma subunit
MERAIEDRFEARFAEANKAALRLGASLALDREDKRKLGG